MTKTSALFVTKRLGLLAAVAATVYAQPLRPVSVQGHSMEPTYKNGSVLLMRRVAPNEIRPGEVVVIDMPFGTIIKRVAYVPGQFHRLALVGSHVCEPFYGLLTHHQCLQKARWLQRRIPEGYVYVLGDNQPVSIDSKQFGFVQLSRIRGVLLDQRQPVPPPDTTNVPIVLNTPTHYISGVFRRNQDLPNDQPTTSGPWNSSSRNLDLHPGRNL